jgi:chorismate synthase
VAAGAIAEKYLKTVYGVEIVAFVASVGKIHIPGILGPQLPASHGEEEGDDETDDVISPEFTKLLSSITRAEVDRHSTRCPHEETAARMTEVCGI